MIDDEDDSESGGIEIEDPTFPGFSKWKRVKYCCTNNAIVVEGVDSIFLGHWEAEIGFPIAVSIIAATSYLVSMIFILPSWKKYGVFCAFLLSLLFFLFIYSYFRTIIDGPGVLPFYWPIKHIVKRKIQHKKDNFDNVNMVNSHNRTDNEKEPFKEVLTDDELSPSGIVSNKKQIEWAKKRPPPPRCILSREGHRYILRPDHVCGWTGTWIGKRNYKFFLLFNFWGFLYIIHILVCMMVEIIKLMKTESFNFLLPVFFLYAFLALTFMILTGTFMCSHTFQMFQNITSYEADQGFDSSAFDKGCKNNIADVCGPFSKWYTFLLPISPWEGMSNTDLAKEYAPFYRMKY